MEDLAKRANNHGVQIICGSNAYKNCVMRSGFVSLGCYWRQPIFNDVGDNPHGDCHLSIVEASGPLLLPGERAWAMHEPRVFVKGAPDKGRCE